MNKEKGQLSYNSRGI